MPLAKVQLMEVPGGPGVTGAVKAGSGITIGPDGTISATGGGGGAVNKVTGGTGITVSPETGDVVVNNSGVTRNSAGRGIKITNNTGDSTISFDDGILENYDPIFLANNDSKSWGDPNGLGNKQEFFTKLSGSYPAGPNKAVLMTRCRCEVGPVGGASYDDTGFMYVEAPAVFISMEDQSAKSRGEWQVAMLGVVGGFKNGTGRSNGTMLIRYDLVDLTSASGGTVSVSLSVTQTASGANNVYFQFPQCVLWPYKV